MSTRGFADKINEATNGEGMIDSAGIHPLMSTGHRDDPPSHGFSEAGLTELPLLIPVPRAARLLGISRSAAYRCAACGDLPTAHLGGRVYIVTSRLQELLESA